MESKKILVILFFLILGQIGCTVNSQPSVSAPAIADYPTDQSAAVYLVSADYPVYQTLEELVNVADLIIQGTVLESLPAHQISDETLSETEQPVVVYTDVVVSVTEVIRGDTELQGKNIIVRRSGGDTGEVYVMAPDAPISQVGGTYLFFLLGGPQRESIIEWGPQQGNYYYMALGGKQGQYFVSEGKLAALYDYSKEAQHLPVPDALNGLEWAEVMAEFKELSATEE